VLVTRVQQERFTDAAAAEVFKQSYVFSLEDCLSLKPDAKIISPLPRLSELPTTIDQQPQAYYFQQAALGVPVRAALLEYVLGLW
jgi:aspartate carbamoyltransferase catalytic subunit